MPELPDWARLVRLTTDELVLVAYYRACENTPAVKESVFNFARISAESCRARLGPDVIPFRKKTR